MKANKKPKRGRPFVYSHGMILKMLDDGFAPKEISHEIGISEPAISKIKKKYGREMSGKPRHYDHTKVKELLRKKVPVKLISEKTGVPRGTVYYVKKNLGL